MAEAVMGIDTSDLDAVLEECTARFGDVAIDEATILVSCPACHKSGKVNAGRFIIDRSATGITEFPVEPGAVCEHGFLALIDARFKAR